MAKQIAPLQQNKTYPNFLPLIFFISSCVKSGKVPEKNFSNTSSKIQGFFMISPSLITYCIVLSMLILGVESIETTTRSVSMPFLNLPVLSAYPNTSALLEVAACNISSGFIPRYTINSISKALLLLVLTPMFPAMQLFTPALSAASNLFFFVLMRIGLISSTNHPTHKPLLPCK